MERVQVSSSWTSWSMLCGAAVWRADGGWRVEPRTRQETLKENVDWNHSELTFQLPCIMWTI